MARYMLYPNIPPKPMQILNDSGVSHRLELQLCAWAPPGWRQPTYANSNAPKIFIKPMVRAHLSRLALLYFYQNPNKDSLRAEYSTQLLKIASMTLVDELQTFYLKVISKTRTWYNEESKALSVEVSKKSMDSFFGSLQTELGID